MLEVSFDLHDASRAIVTIALYLSWIVRRNNSNTPGERLQVILEGLEAIPTFEAERCVLEGMSGNSSCFPGWT